MTVSGDRTPTLEELRAFREDLTEKLSQQGSDANKGIWLTKLSRRTKEGFKKARILEELGMLYLQEKSSEAKGIAILGKAMESGSYGRA